VQLNRFRAGVHCDSGSEPGSNAVAVAFGEYEGGALCIWPRGTAVADANAGRVRMVVAADIKDKPLPFDPFAPHAAAGWAGDRCSVILFTVRGCQNADTSVRSELRDLGFVLQEHAAEIVRPGAMQEERAMSVQPAQGAAPLLGVQEQESCSSAERLVRVRFHLHGDGTRSGWVKAEEAACIGMLFQEFIGSTVTPSTWRNLRFRVGSIT
jgi:hypothetical protein